MSILIKGMEMPESCWRCCLSQLYEKPRDMLVCKITHEEVLRHKIDGNCPLVPVPPHGRLGDLDDLEQMFVDIDNAPYSGFDGEESFYSAEDAAQIIRLTPTVIPADKEGET